MNAAVFGDNVLHRAIRRWEPANHILDLVHCNPMLAQEKNEFGETPLHLACRSRDYSSVIARCLELFPSLTKETNDYGDTPLHIAIMCTEDEMGIIRLLIDTADQSVLVQKNIAGYCPLRLACQYPSCGTIVEYMLQYVLQRSDNLINVKDKSGSTPLHIACRHGSYNSVELLLQHPNIDVNAVDSVSNTPLHMLCRPIYFDLGIGIDMNTWKKRQLAIMTKILSHPNIVSHPKNQNGKTPIDFIKDGLDIWRHNESQIAILWEMKLLLEEHSIKQRRWII